MSAVGAMELSGEWVEPAAAVDALYRAEARSLLGMLTVYVGNRALAEDLVQEAFARVQRTWSNIRDKDRAPQYLRTIAFNLARSNLRRRVRSLPVVDVDPYGSAEDGFVLREDQRAVVAAVQRLPKQQRACVILRYYTELGIDDIAATLGISPNSVKTHLQRGLDALGASLGGVR